MTTWTLIRRSLRFHARAHLGVLLGAAVGSAVLIGALLVGDSVRESLREMALVRLGKTYLAMATGDRLFRSELSSTFPSDSSWAASILALPATASSGDGKARANRVQVLGVDRQFWKFVNRPAAFGDPPTDGVVLNQPLADQLQAKIGDAVVLRVSKPSQLVRDAPLSPQEDTSAALRLTVLGIAKDEQLGRFSLQANQVAPFNAFVSLKQLQDKAGATNRANLFLAGREPAKDVKPLHISSAVLSNMFGFGLRKNWQLADAELELRPLTTTGELELRTSRVFLDPSVVEAALKAVPDARLIQTYFVNELRLGERAAPYSMVTGAGAPLAPAEMKDDEILLNQWLADDLHAKPGEEVSLRYFIVGLGRALEERTNIFRVRAVVPMALPHADRELMPDFPGVARAESTSDWDGSLPIDAKRIRPPDEKYWKDWRGTPKAFVTLAAGEKMWNNRFGVVTAVRFPVPLGESAAELKSSLDKRILANLDPAAIGLRFEPVREQALKAAEQSQDFGGLFIGFSFFLIVAALVLMALLFQFGIEQRAVEVGTLLALGFTPGHVRRLLLLEGFALSLLGSLLGLAGGIAYARVMLHGLTTIWREAVGTVALQYHATPATLAGGLAGSVLVALFTMWLALRKQARQSARELLAGENMETPLQAAPGRKQNRLFIAGAIFSTLALAMIGSALLRRDTASAEMFFGAGACLLLAALSFSAAFLTRLEFSTSGETAGPPTLTGLGLRNVTRRRRRSLATMTMLASGSFLIVSIGAFRLDENENATKRTSGTGGFALLGESTLPVVHDLNSKAGRDFYNLDGKVMADVAVVPFRVRDGDDASCLNLNRAQKPRLLGVKPMALEGRFAFAKKADGVVSEHPWLTLQRGAFYPMKGQPLAADEVAAFADEASILWALGKKLGDTLDYTDERGRVFKVRLVGALANSILQGNLIIDEAEFVRRFPGEAGYRMFLIDVPSNRASGVAAAMTRALGDAGLELMPATRRLAAFNAVQNTYLSTFQVLGGLGLLLGSVGLGVVVLRNVLERRGELALLLAVGFPPRTLQWLVFSEHGALLLLGLVSGVIAAAVAVLPALLTPGSELPYASLAWTLGGVLVSGAVWTWLATRLALRGRLLDALRNE